MNILIMAEDTEVRNEFHLSVENQQPQSAVKIQIALKSKDKTEEDLLKDGKALFDFAVKSTNDQNKKLAK